MGLVANLKTQLVTSITTVFLIIMFVCVDVLPTCMHLYCMSNWFPQKSEEAIGSPGTVVTDGYEHHVGAEN